MNRSWMKAKCAAALCRTGMDRVVNLVTGQRNASIVVGYHRVVEDYSSSVKTSIPSQLVTAQMLERHLDWIGRRYRFVDLDELGSVSREGNAGRQPVAAVTFDDGYRDFYHVALPLLRRKGIPAALFVVTDLVGTERVQVHDRLYLLLKRRLGHGEDALGGLRNFDPGLPLPEIRGMSPYYATRALLEALPMEALEKVIAALNAEDPLPGNALRDFYSVTWDMLARIHSAGIIVGSHTKTHILMANESERKLTYETLGSRLELERRLGADVRHFAYPSGVFNERSVRAVAAAGYDYAYTTCSHRSMEHPALTLSRTLLWQNASLDDRDEFSGFILNCQVQRVFDLVAGCRQRHTLNQDATGGAVYGGA